MMTGWRGRLNAFVCSQRVQNAIAALIIANAVMLGLETAPETLGGLSPWLHGLDGVIVAVFVVEIVLKLIAQGPRFFRSGWNVFDFVVISVTLMPTSQNLSVLRALRILRALRLVSVVPQMRKVVEALLAALPGLGSISGLLLLVFYIGAVMATQMFGREFPDWFGSVGASMYSLFQIMTLESWSMGIVRPVMEVHGWAWAFFVPFILMTSFAVLNLFIAVIVDAMGALHQGDREAVREIGEREHAFLAAELDSLRGEIAALREAVREAGGPRTDDRPSP